MNTKSYIKKNEFKAGFRVNGIFVKLLSSELKNLAFPPEYKRDEKL